jgi:transcriptional regulator of acetoin/glycerol metabolism
LTGSSNTMAAGGEPAVDMRAAWEEFVSGRAELPGIRQEILLSWRRCRDELAIDPSRNHAQTPDDEPTTLAAASAAAELGAAAASIAADVEALGGVVVATDGEGRVLGAWGEHAAMTRAHDWNLVPWASWLEVSTGTTAVALALRSHAPVAVNRAEHWCEALHDLSCAAVAVRDPATGEAIGVIDISIWGGPLPPEVVGWLGSTAAEIEQRLTVRAVRAPLTGTLAASPPKRLIGVRGNRFVVVRVDEIRRVEISDRIVWLDTDSGRVRTNARSLDELEPGLQLAGFVRINRHTLVNVDRVREIEPGLKGGMWLLIDGADRMIPISRRRFAVLAAALEAIGR